MEFSLNYDLEFRPRDTVYSAWNNSLSIFFKIRNNYNFKLSETELRRLLKQRNFTNHIIDSLRSESSKVGIRESVLLNDYERIHFYGTMCSRNILKVSISWANMDFERALAVIRDCILNSDSLSAVYSI